VVTDPGQDAGTAESGEKSAVSPNTYPKRFAGAETDPVSSTRCPSPFRVGPGRANAHERSDMARSNMEYKMLEFELGGPGALGGGTIAPFFVCATCGERITGGDANVLFERNAKGGLTGRFVVAHRRRECDAPWNNGRQWWEWQSLDSLLMELLDNSGYDSEALVAGQRRLHALRAKIVDDPDREPESFSELFDYVDAGIWTVG
jgi:hypothetical protein